MDPNAQFVLTYLNSVGLLSLIAIAYGSVRRMPMPTLVLEAALGLLFSAIAILMMLQPAVLAEGIRFDGRVPVVAIATGFAGPLAGGVTATVVGAYRIYLGGAGVWVGVGTLLMGFCVGLGFWTYRRRGGSSDLTALTVFGLVIGSHVFGFLFVPMPLTPSLFALMFVSVVSTSALSAIVVGSLIAREERMIVRELALAADANSDSLTGLANRRAFERRLNRATRASKQQSYCVLMLDVDHFKSVNDRLGHEAGDRVLVAVARAIDRAMRTQDLVARIGGEEFAVILETDEHEGAVAAAERVRLAVEVMEVELGTDIIKVSVSVGVSRLGTFGTESAEILRSADEALYRAKANGRNRVEAAYVVEPSDPGRLAPASFVAVSVAAAT